MKVALELNESDIRLAILKVLTEKGYPPHMLEWFGSNDFEVKTTYRSNEGWRKPRYLRFTIDKVVKLL